MSRNKEHRPNGAAAEGGACVSDYFISSVFMDSLHIPYIFHIYIYIFPSNVPYIFPCVFLNLFNQQ